MKFWRVRAAFGICCLLACSACGSRGGPAGDRIHVVAGENFWADIVAQVGGDRVAVTSMIGPGGDPHEYEANVHDAAAVARAQLVIENGLGYDDFLAKLVSASPSSDRAVLVIAHLVRVSGADANPHLWYGPAYVLAAARAIEAALTRASPNDAAVFRANLNNFLAGEQGVIDVIDRIRTKYAGAAIAYTERVPGYLLDAAGLRLGTPASFSRSIEQGEDASPADGAAFEQALTHHAVRVLVYNAQVTDSATTRLRELAMRSEVPVVGMTETLPSTEPDFQTWQADQARALLGALGG